MNIGDKVIIKHQREMGECTVVNPHDPTIMTILVGEENGVKIHKAVEYYVRVDTPKAKNQGYHPENVELV